MIANLAQNKYASGKNYMKNNQGYQKAPCQDTGQRGNPGYNKGRSHGGYGGQGGRGNSNNTKP